MSKETFKEFIKNKPYLAKAVYDNKVTFQKLYEIYDIYGEDSDFFDSFIDNNFNNTRSLNSFSDVTNMLRGIDLNTIQKGVNGLQKVVSLVQEMVPNKQLDNQVNVYDERPINKYYED